MIKILFVCHGRKKDYCFVLELLGQNGADEGKCCATVRLRLTEVKIINVVVKSSLVVPFETPLTIVDE